MERRELIKNSAFAVAAFAFSKELFAKQVSNGLNKYQEGSNGGVIKLSSNENPHGPAESAKKAMIDAVIISNRYQFDTNAQLREAIGKLTGHATENILLGAGSSELLGVVTSWTAYKKGNIVASEPTFKVWLPAARKLGLPTKLVPLTSTKHNDLLALQNTIDAETKMVYLCNPNNPTGTVSSKADLESFVKTVTAKTVLLMDEAYTDYYDSPSMSHLVNSNPNLIIAKTFSKTYGMAGARVGYVLAHPDTIKELSSFMAWANAGPSAVSMKGALGVINDKAFIDYVKAENIKAKAILYKGFNDLGIKYIESFTSFVYFDTKTYPKNIPDVLKANNIVGARSFEDNSSWLRISIGTVQEMTKVVEALKAGASKV